MRIRTQFAAPFVMVVATAACGGKSPPHKNPPPPKTEKTVAACTDQKEGEACNAGDSCQVAAKDGCGPISFSCTDGKWTKLEATCNPPPPASTP